MARKGDEAANFALVPGIYDRRYPDYARRDKVDLAWEKISHEMKESGMYIYIYMITKTYKRIKIQNMSAKTMQTTTTIWTRAL
jgi:hypothetical protein